MEWLRCARDHAKRGGGGIKNTFRELRPADAHDAEGLEEVLKHYPQPEGTRPTAVLATVQAQRGMKRVTRPRLGSKSGEAAQQTFAGMELMHMWRQGHRDDGVGQGLPVAEQCSSLAASSLPKPAELPPKCLHTKICDKTTRRCAEGWRPGPLGSRRSAGPRLPATGAWQWLAATSRHETGCAISHCFHQEAGDER